MKAMLEKGFKADEFKHVELYDVPGLGHAPPGAEWFERAIDFLDALPKDRLKKSPTSKPARPVPTSRPHGGRRVAD